MQVLRGRVVTPTEVIDDGVIAHAGGVITHVGTWQGAPEHVRVRPLPPEPEGYLLPGLIDIHNHGGGGISIPDSASAEEILQAVAEHRAHGTTRMIASLVTAPPDALREKVELLADLAASGHIAGIHLEGPFISRTRCGAQNPAHIRPGDPEFTADLLRRGAGHIRTMTIAPETPNLRPVLTALIDAGAVPSFGHTDADDLATREALSFTHRALSGTGRRASITHLFNGMRPIHHRVPGPIPPLLAAARRGEVVAEVIGDGAHVHPGLVSDLFELVGADNIALITDAMAAAGMPDGTYRLGSLDVLVSGGVARLAGEESIAGSTAHLLDVVRTTVAGGVGLVDAVRSATVVPARLIDPGARFGALQVGYAADVLRVDEHLGISDGPA